MKWEPCLALVGARAPNAVLRRLLLGCVLAIKRSTWGQFAKTGPGFMQNDVAQMAKAMTRFVVAPLGGLSDFSVRLSGNCYMIGQRFDPYDFAQVFSQEICCASMYLSPAAIAARDASDIENQATAALLFRYKHCFLAEEFFDVKAVSQWVRLISAKRGEGVSNEVLLHLLEVMKAVCGDVVVAWP